MLYVHEAGRLVVDTGSTVASQVVPITAAVTVGNTLIMCAHVYGGTTETFSATDTKGNTWVSRLVEEVAPTNVRLVVLTCAVTTAMTTSDTITLTALGNPRANWIILVDEFSGVTAFDLALAASGSASTAINSGVSAAGAQDSELVYMVGGWSSGTAVLSSTQAGFTVGTMAQTVTTPRMLNRWWQFVNTPGTRSATGTLSSATAWGSILLVMKGTASGNLSPTANAGVDQTGLKPWSTATLSGTGSDSDGTIASYSWVFKSSSSGKVAADYALTGTGATRTITTPAVAGGDVSVWGLTVTDNLGATSTEDTVSISTVAPGTFFLSSGGVWTPMRVRAL